MTEIAIFLALTFAIFCGVLAIGHSLMVGRITLLDWALLAIGGMYGVGWCLVFSVTQRGGNPAWQHWIAPFPELYLVHTAASFMLVGGLLGGWYVQSGRLPLSDAPTLSVRHGWYAQCWAWALWVLLVLALLSQGLYTKAYGGFLGQLDYSALIRSSLFDQVPRNSWSFLKPFGGLAMIAAYGFFGLWLSGRRGIGTTIGLILAFVFSLYILYSWLGRMGFLVFLATFLLGAQLSRRSNPLKVIAWAGVAFISILISAYGVSKWLNLKAAASLTEFLAQELSYPFGSFFAQLEHGGHLSRGFIDFVLAPIYLLPSSWWTGWFDSVGQVNTTVIMGAPKGEGGVAGAIPTDLLTLGLMQAHLVGVIVVGALFGLLLRTLQVLIDRIPFHGVRGVFEAHIALNIAVLGVFYAQPNLVVSTNFALLVGSLIIAVQLRVHRNMRPYRHKIVARDL